jgi:hypothetical protein
MLFDIRTIVMLFGLILTLPQMPACYTEIAAANEIQQVKNEIKECVNNEKNRHY